MSNPTTTKTLTVTQFIKKYNYYLNHIKFCHKYEQHTNAQIVESLISNFTNQQVKKMRIKNIKDLQRLADLAECEDVGLTLEIAISHGFGHTRKNVYADLSCFNYIDETECNFKSDKQAHKYWNKYFSKNLIYFNGLD
jgi:hypothetical protein